MDASTKEKGKSYVNHASRNVLIMVFNTLLFSLRASKVEIFYAFRTLYANIVSAAIFNATLSQNY